MLKIWNCHFHIISCIQQKTKTKAKQNATECYYASANGHIYPQSVSAMLQATVSLAFQVWLNAHKYAEMNRQRIYIIPISF